MNHEIFEARLEGVFKTNYEQHILHLKNPGELGGPRRDLMASFLILLKEYEDDEKVVYRFGPNEQAMGKLELNKKKETIQEIEPVNADNESNFYFNRAAQRLARCLYYEYGEFPEKTTFES